MFIVDFINTFYVEHRRDLAEDNWLDLEHSVRYLMWMQQVRLSGDVFKSYWGGAGFESRS